MDIDTLYTMLKKAQESKGCYFNQNDSLTRELLKNLLVNRERYGYMACPCRLAAGQRELDRDIFCPCQYRGPDMEEFGTCFCGLYVTDEYITAARGHTPIPERRSPEKILAGVTQSVHTKKKSAKE